MSLIRKRNLTEAEALRGATNALQKSLSSGQMPLIVSKNQRDSRRLAIDHRQLSFMDLKSYEERSFHKTWNGPVYIIGEKINEEENSKKTTKKKGAKKKQYSESEFE